MSAAPEMVDENTPVRIRDFHGSCGARIFTGWAAGEHTPRYFASEGLDARELAECPVCGGALVTRVPNEYHAGSCQADHGGTHGRSTVVTAFEMERRYLAARERMCGGAPLDAEVIVCMSAELEEGRTLEEMAPLYGREAETLRGEIAAFTTTHTTTE